MVVANLQYGATKPLCMLLHLWYLFTTKILGKRRSLFWVVSLMIIGSILLAINPSDFFFLEQPLMVGTGFLNQTFQVWWVIYTRRRS